MMEQGELEAAFEALLDGFTVDVIITPMGETKRRNAGFIINGEYIKVIHGQETFASEKGATFENFERLWNDLQGEPVKI